MQLNEYQNFIANKWQYRKDDNLFKHLFVICTGLAGETGEVLEPIKKHIRDGKPIDTQELILECGDVLAYLTKIADYFGFTLQEIIDANVVKLSERFKVVA